MNKDSELDRIREILLRHWDPVSVGDNPKLADEYDVYLGEVADMLAKGCGSTELYDHLRAIESVDMGLELPQEQRWRAVKALLNTADDD
jgi:hypothetical protein